MQDNRQTRFTTGKCPVCGEQSVEQTPGLFFSFKRPSHRCTQCDAQLTTKMLWYSWVAIPLAWFGFPLVANLRDWVIRSMSLDGFLAKLAEALVVGPAVATAVIVLASGVVFRVWVPPSGAA